MSYRFMSNPINLSSYNILTWKRYQTFLENESTFQDLIKDAGHPMLVTIIPTNIPVTFIFPFDSHRQRFGIFLPTTYSLIKVLNLDWYNSFTILNLIYTSCFPIISISYLVVAESTTVSNLARELEPKGHSKNN